MVRYGGLLKPNKGINLPGLEVSAPAISERDARKWSAPSPGVDYIAMSFVQRGEDVEALRRLVPPSVRIIAKIEKDTALQNIKGILRAADAIMVARGDLGVELPFEEVPLTQKRLIREANIHGKPVITATQMLESMVHAPRPTRAEASDVANAILDGTDAVMLSAETAVGPTRVSRWRPWCGSRGNSAAAPGRSPAFDIAVGRRVEKTDRLLTDDDAAAMTTRTESAIAVAVCAAAELMQAPAIVCLTSSGFRRAQSRPTGRRCPSWR